MLIPATLCFVFLLISFDQAECAPKKLDAGSGKWRFKNPSSCHPECKHDESCMQKSIEIPSCQRPDCKDVVCGDKQECTVMSYGGIKCIDKVTCDGIKCKKGEVCKVGPLQGCSGDCPMEAACVKK